MRNNTKTKLRKQLDGRLLDLRQVERFRRLKVLSSKFKRTGWIEPIR